MDKIKIIVILGPTATGKSDLAILLAKKFNGEVISADSRQVYRGMNIGTGKVTRKEIKDVPHYLLDIISPKNIFTVSEYKKRATEAIIKILKKDKIPIICGGTGLYIQSIIDDLVIPEVPANPEFRKKLEKRSVDELYEMLKNVDPRRAEEIDRKNKVRLIRAIEITEALGFVPELKKVGNKYDFLQIGLMLDKDGLNEKIHGRLLKRIRAGMIAEVKRLVESGVSWKRLHDFGLEYRFVANHIKGKTTRNEMIRLLEIAIRQYAKRQMTWFKRDKRIRWFDPKDVEKIETEIENFL